MSRLRAHNAQLESYEPALTAVTPRLTYPTLNFHTFPTLLIAAVAAKLAPTTSTPSLMMKRAPPCRTDAACYTGTYCEVSSYT